MSEPSSKLKCGIEIHQRLSGRKLFCSCQSLLSEGAPARAVVRKQHPVVSEMGTMDAAALFEASADREFLYLAPPVCSCLVELDEEPPHRMSKEALDAGIEICTHFYSQVMDEVQVMRKAVIDGSNTSGFQRTALLSAGGYIETSKGKVGIQTISIEEESAGIVKREGSRTTYRLDRLGMPLVEITTAPDIVDGEHAMETAQRIGELLRLSGHAQRGIGSIRQDVNVSVPGGARVEIKGAQELSEIPLLIDNEVKRQEGLLKIVREVQAKFGGGIPEIDAYTPDASSVFANTACGLIKKVLQAKGKVLGLRLPKHAGLLGRELYEGRRYGTELSDYAKSAGAGGIIHSDEDLSKYQITFAEISNLKARLALEEGDAFVLVAAEERIARKALLAVWGRAMEMEVPGETRRALPGGKSEYMRPIGGGGRMYPETDIPPVRVKREEVEAVGKKVQGKSPREIKERVGKLLNKDLSAQILKSRHLKLFLELSEKTGDAPLVAITLTKTLTELRREGIEFADVEGILSDLFSSYSSGLFVKAAIPEILRGMKEGKKASEVVEEKGVGRIFGEELKKKIEEEGGSLPRIMAKYRLRVNMDELVGLIGKKA